MGLGTVRSGLTWYSNLVVSEVGGIWGGVVLGLVPWALDSSNIAQEIPPSNVLMGEVKLGFVPANEDHAQSDIYQTK